MTIDARCLITVLLIPISSFADGTPTLDPVGA